MPAPSNDIDASNDSAVGGDRWYVAQTQPRAEGRAIAHLERQGYQVFCPRFHKTVRHARKARQVLAPLFPNYLLFDFDASRDLLRAVTGTLCVVGLVFQEDPPAALEVGISY